MRFGIGVGELHVEQTAEELRSLDDLVVGRADRLGDGRGLRLVCIQIERADLFLAYGVATERLRLPGKLVLEEP